MTTATYIRRFVNSHPAYKHDSVVSAEITYDLTVAIDEIERGVRPAEELLGPHYLVGAGIKTPETPMPESPKATTAATVEGMIEAAATEVLKMSELPPVKVVKAELEYECADEAAVLAKLWKPILCGALAVGAFTWGC